MFEKLFSNNFFFLYFFNILLYRNLEEIPTFSMKVKGKLKISNKFLNKETQKPIAKEYNKI